jgi:hypothetical protein
MLGTVIGVAAVICVVAVGQSEGSLLATVGHSASARNHSNTMLAIGTIATTPARGKTPHAGK